MFGIIKKMFILLLTSIKFIIFWDLLTLYQSFLAQQEKRDAIITCKHGIYELPRGLPNDLRLTIWGN